MVADTATSLTDRSGCRCPAGRWACTAFILLTTTSSVGPRVTSFTTCTWVGHRETGCGPLGCHGGAARGQVSSSSKRQAEVVGLQEPFQQSNHYPILAWWDPPDLQVQVWFLNENHSHLGWAVIDFQIWNLTLIKRLQPDETDPPTLLLLLNLNGCKAKIDSPLRKDNRESVYLLTPLISTFGIKNIWIAL